MVDRRPSRENKVLVAGHFPKPVAKQLRHLAVEEETTVQALLGEAIYLLLAGRGIDPSDELMETAKALVRGEAVSKKRDRVG